MIKHKSVAAVEDEGGRIPLEMADNRRLETQEPSVDADKLSYEIFSILESKFLFGYDDQKLWIPKQIDQKNQLSSRIKNQRGKICILSIDGGGMRGIIPGKALAYLERSLKKVSANHDARISDYFDVAAGTGIGGIFTAMLFATKNNRIPIFDGEDTWRLLSDQGKRFYRTTTTATTTAGGFLRRLLLRSSAVGSAAAAAAGLEKVVKEAFTEDGRQLTLKDTLKPVLIPCYDLSTSAPFLFSRADALETDSFDFRLWEVCRATSAEPDLFEPVVMQSVDGRTRCVAVDGRLGMMSNPTAAAITHVLHNKQEFPFVRGVEDILVLSLGTGQFFDGGCCGYEQVKGWRARDWARPLARVSGDGAADLVDGATAMAFGQFRESNYVRIQANGSALGRFGANVDSDSSPNNVKMLMGIADEMLKQKNVESVLFGGKKIGEESNFERLDWFARQLVQEHQRRSCRIAPTVVFKQASQKP